MQARGDDVDEDLVGRLRSGRRDLAVGRWLVECGDYGCVHRILLNGRCPNIDRIANYIRWYHELFEGYDGHHACG